MPDLLLPRLEDGAGVDNITVAGRWDKRDRSVLTGVSSGLTVPKFELFSAEVDSIPSMWARPLLFDMALYETNTNHPMHQRVLGEWRGLLAMLALKEWDAFPLTIKPHNIYGANPTDDSISKDEKDFLKTLHRVIPKDTLDPNITWETLNIILFDGNPIGMTSPTTLVCTAVNCLNRISGVPWYNGKFLIDPVDNDELNNSQKNVVAAWLKNLRQHTLKLPDGNNKKARINGLLDEFITKLGGATVVFDFSSASLGMEQQPLFRYMDKPVAPNNNDLSSSVELVPSRKYPPPKTRLLVPDKTISEDWGLAPQNVSVWGNTTLATMQGFSGKSKLNLPENVKQWSQKNFFTDKLFVINQDKAFHEHRTLISTGSDNLYFNGELRTPILPINEELLTYLNVEDLNDRITFKQPSRDSSITVDLCLTLSGINGKKQDFSVSKEYGAKDVKPISTAPILAIWPNFKTPNWKAYYTYFTTDEQDAFYAKPFLATGQKSDTQTFSSNRNIVEKEITKTGHFPEAMLCEYKGNKAGILLIKIPTHPDDNHSSDWSVGVDFGTSSTTVYSREIGTDPKRVTFKNRLLPITAPRGDSNPTFYKDFFSPNSEKTPFFSLFQRLGNKETNEPLLDGHIYFLLDSKGLHGAKNIISNLKWSINPQDRRYIKTFLQQLCLQCAAEAVDAGAEKINWNFSVPLAFRDADIAYFENIWQEIGKSCESATGLSHQVMLPAQSESVVTAKFFDATTNGFPTGAVCIDIGGETSDISIWYERDLYWQTSLNFAGRHIFLNLLRKNPGVLRHLDVDNEDINRLKNVPNSKEEFYAQADALIQEKGTECLRNLSGTHGSVPEIQPFIRLISLGVTGLLYYVGLILKYLSKNDNFNPKIPSIYIGGNGSKILHWMAKGKFDPENNSNRMAQQCKEHLKRITLAASGSDYSNVEINISESPKNEAAYGLITQGADLTTNETQYGILAGEAFTEKGENREWTEILTDERFRSRLRVDKSQLELIKHFIDTFNAGLDENDNMLVDLDEVLGDKSLSTEIFDVLAGKLGDYSDRGDEAEPFEPLFILALKALLNAKQGAWEE